MTQIRPFCVQTVLSILLIVTFLTCPIAGGGKKHKINRYSEEANAADADALSKYDDKFSLDTNELPSSFSPDSDNIDMHSLQKPFRMAKLNLVWTKAQQRLTQPKLKSLFFDLRIQDKAELTWKQQNGQHKDKDGLKEAELRQKLIAIMSNYGILEHFDDSQDPAKYKHHKAYEGKGSSKDQKSTYKNKSLFKDKKLNKLWEKAEVSGFTAEELKALREEFEHHQEKVDLYYSILDRVDDYKPHKHQKHENAVNEDELDNFNEIAAKSDEDHSPNVVSNKHHEYVNDANLVREKHRDLRDNIDRLERLTAKGPSNQEFVEPKVLGLWRVASEGNFTSDELASIKMELLHYESRLLKLRHLHAENALNRERYKGVDHQSKHDKYASMDDHIKKQSRKIEKIHENLEEKIFKHVEL